MKKLDGKVALVTGGGSGIGAETSYLYAKEGAKVVVVDLNEENAKKVCDKIVADGGEAIYASGDVSKTEDVDLYFKKTVEAFGTVDILFNNAGVGPTGASEDFDYDTFKWVVDVDLNAVFYNAQQAIRLMLENEDGGVIVNTASMYGWVGASQSAAYNAAKGGVVNLTRSLGVEYADRNIRINALCPGYIDTPIIASELKEALTAATPMKRMGQADEIAKAALFLSSDDSSFMTGQSLIVDGGYTAS